MPPQLFPPMPGFLEIDADSKSATSQTKEVRNAESPIESFPIEMIS